MGLPAVMGFDLDNPGIVHRLNEIADSMATSTGDEAKDAAEKAKLFVAYAKIHKAAEEIRRAAFRVEAYALRRIGQLRMENQLKLPETRNAARLFGDFSDQEFSGWILRFHGDSAVGFKRWIVWTEERDRRDTAFDRWESGQGGAPVRHYDPEGAAESVRSAVITLVQAMDGESWTVEDVVTKVLDEFDPDPIRDYGLIRHAMRDVVRNVVNQAVTTVPTVQEVGGNGIRGRVGIGDLIAPLMITLESTDHGWVRIPFTMATLTEFEWFVTFREEQAAELTEKAARFRLLLRAMREQADEDDARCGDLVGPLGPRRGPRKAKVA